MGPRHPCCVLRREVGGVVITAQKQKRSDLWARHWVLGSGVWSVDPGRGQLLAVKRKPEGQE